jgi:Glycosyltransferase family 87
MALPVTMPLSRTRRRFNLFRFCLTVVGVNLCLMCAAAGAWYAIAGVGAGIDFSIFVQSGHALAHGQNPYGSFSGPTWVHPAWGRGPNLNPPASLLFFRLLDGVPALLTFRLWQGASILCIVLSVTVSKSRRMTPLMACWIAALAGVWNTLFAGQVYGFLALGTAVAWRWMRQGHMVRACCAIGILVAIKPQLAIWLGLLFLAGYARPSLCGAAVAVTLMILPTVLFGGSVYREWFHVLPGPFVGSITNASLVGFGTEVGAPWLGYAASGCVLLAASAWALRTRPSAARVSALALPLALLISPVTWVGYTVLLLPIFLSRRWSGPLKASAVLLLLSDSQIVALCIILTALVGHPFPIAIVRVIAIGLLLWPARDMNQAKGTIWLRTLTSPFSTDVRSPFWSRRLNATPPTRRHRFDPATEGKG